MLKRLKRRVNLSGDFVAELGEAAGRVENGGDGGGREVRHGGPEVFGVSVSPHGVIEVLSQVRRLIEGIIRIWGTSWERNTLH